MLTAQVSGAMTFQGVLPGEDIAEPPTRSRRSNAAIHDGKEHLAVDKDRVTGAAHEAKGAVKEAAGKLTGDTKTQAEGKAEKVQGKVQNAAGGAKDAARDAVNKD
jgi:uncharacterized protein YjbJ (UPF0337 family)